MARTSIALAGTALAFVSALTGCLRPPAQRAPAAANVTQAPVPPPASPPAAAATPSRSVPGLPASFLWTSSGPIIVPKSDATHDLVAVKDPTVVYFGDGRSVALVKRRRDMELFRVRDSQGQWTG